MTEQESPSRVRFPPEMKAEIHAYAKATGITFSAAVLVLCREALDHRTRNPYPCFPNE